MTKLQAAAEAGVAALPSLDAQEKIPDPLPMRKLTDQLRQAIEGGPKSRYQIAKETGIDEATLSRFVHGKGGLSMEGLDIIAECLGLRLTDQPPPRRQGKGKAGRTTRRTQGR